MITITETRTRRALGEAQAVDGMAALGLSWWEAARQAPGSLPGPIYSLPAMLTFAIEQSYVVEVLEVSPTRFEFALKIHVGSHHSFDVITLDAFGPHLRYHRRPLYDGLSIVVFSGTPNYQKVEVNDFDGALQCYRRLILPLAKNDSRVEQLLVLISPGHLANA